MHRRETFANIFQKWQAKATLEELTKLAELSQSTVPALRQLANAYRTGGQLSTRADMAIALETAAAAIHRPGLPVLKREHFSGACASCDFAKRCRKADRE